MFFVSVVFARVFSLISKKFMTTLKVFAFFFVLIIILFLLRYGRWGSRFVYLRDLMGVSCLYSFDVYSVCMSFVLFFVRGFIIWYSVGYYFVQEPKKRVFFFYLIIFIFFIYLLVFSKSLFFILIRWEGVGIISFFLIGWWSGRSEATQCSIQAVIYNRVRDFGIYLALVVVFVYIFRSLDFNSYNRRYFHRIFLSFWFFLAAISKSSQFLFHPWLPNAIEGPTPVSSLLHSSTMVVARVFFFIRTFSEFNIFSNSLIVFLGAITMLYGGLCRLGQSDVKKIIAFSTTSQLRFMVVSVGVIRPQAGFFLLLLHSFFKSLLFIGSGVLIHSSNGDQGVENISTFWQVSSLVKFSFLLASLSLMRFPFFSGFYSKDLLLENVWGPLVNRMFVIVIVLGSVFTVRYTLRSLFLFRLGSSMVSKGFKLVGEEKIGVNVSWILGLSLGSVGFGFIFSDNLYRLFSEEVLTFFLKFFPIFILFIGSCLSVLAIYWLDGALGLYMYFYNPVIHRLINSVVLNANQKFLILELYWVELVLRGFKGLVGLPGEIGLTLFSIRTYFLTFTGCVMLLFTILFLVGL